MTKFFLDGLFVFVMLLTIFVMQASSAESDRHYSAFNARHIITPLRNRLCPDVVEAVSINLESYKNSLL